VEYGIRNWERQGMQRTHHRFLNNNMRTIKRIKGTITAKEIKLTERRRPVNVRDIHFIWNPLMILLHLLISLLSMSIGYKPHQSTYFSHSSPIFIQGKIPYLPQKSSLSICLSCPTLPFLPVHFYLTSLI
jgi:hypothetical protein